MILINISRARLGWAVTLEMTATPKGKLLIDFPWGQMSFWAATVITNLASAIPIYGTDIVVWFWELLV